MGLKTFIEINGLQLVSDERDVMVPAKHYTNVVEWCKQNNIDIAQIQGTYNHYIAMKMFKVNLWRVKDQEQRVMFILRWGSL